MTKAKSAKSLAAVVAAEQPAGPDLSYISPPLRGLARPIEEFRLDPRNANTHTSASNSAIAGSLRQFGQVKPIVVQAEGGIIRAGNGTYQAAVSLGWTHIAAVVMEGKDEAFWVAYGIADNRTGELSEWDEGRLAELLREIEVVDEDLDAMFSGLADELKLYEGPAETPAAEPETPGVQPPADEARSWQVLITCRDDAHQREVLERCQAEGLDVKAFAG